MILRDAMKKFKEDLIRALPQSKEMDKYKKLIKEKEVSGVGDKNNIGYAIVADKRKMEMSEINAEEDVIYVVQKLKPVSDLSALLIQYSPWNKTKIPENAFSSKDVKIIVRRVTKKEADKVKEINTNILDKNKSMFEEANAKSRTKEDIKKPEILSDMAFNAIRMEFGIGQKQNKHWGYACKKFRSNLMEMVKSNKKYKRCVSDIDYTQWQKDLPKLKKMPVQEFMQDCKKFQEKVIK